MQVQKRNGTREAISFDKVLGRVRRASKGLNVNPDALAQQVLSQIYDGVKTSELDELTAQLAAGLATLHPDYGTLAARISISNHQKSTPTTYSAVVELLSKQTHPKNGEPIAYLHPNFIDFVRRYAARIDERIQYDRDYLLDYFGFKTLEKSYLLRSSDLTVVERPQHMWMRVALGLWFPSQENTNIDDETRLMNTFETYDLLSQKYFTHATPTLFNAGTPRAQLSSCFLLSMSDDSIQGIYKTLSDCASISKYAGGIGIHIHNVRARGSLIKGTNGTSNGIVPMLRVFNNTARYVDQGGGRRNGSFAMYLEPWHADLEEFLKMKLNTGAEEERARDLFYALWIPDLFMERVETAGEWTLFCPNEAPGLAEVWGDEFKRLYERYETEGRGRKKVNAQKLWFQILDSQMETGTPYLLYKDAANRKSNQQNIGTIKSSNLCTEIIEYSDANETAVCNLASIALPAFVKDGIFDFEHLRAVTTTVIRNLDRVIDINYYPTPETRRSNMRHRPVGLGCQGLADVFAMMGLSWESDEALKLNQLIFEHMYYAAVKSSIDLARTKGNYSTFEGSPANQGKLQPDLWAIMPLTEKDGSLNWTSLRDDAKKHMRNSLLLAPMPTASTSQILGYNECFEPFTSNLYTRRTLAGEFIVVNKYLLKDLLDRGLWSEAMKQQIVARNGSVQGIPDMPEDLQARYKTSYELKQKILIDMAAARGAFICQSQSLNLFVADPTYAKLTSMHFYAWRQGLKTGCYYLRTKAPVMAQKFTVDPRLLAAVQNQQHRVADGDNESVIDSDSESENESDKEESRILSEEDLRKAARRAQLEKLTAEYEAEVQAIKDAKDRGEEVCEMCSS